MSNEPLTTADLMARTQVPGKRPDAALKRLRREGILARPTRGKGRGRARGVTWWYPPGSDLRVNRVVELRGQGMRAFRDLRWQLWFEGASEVWKRLKADLLAAYPAGLDAWLRSVPADDQDSVDDAIGSAAVELADRWGARPLPTGQPTTRTPTPNRETLAHVAVAAAIPGHALPLDSVFDEMDPRTTADLVASTWGSGAASVHNELVESGASDATRWLEALRNASTAEAAGAAELLRRTLNPKLMQRDLRLFGDEWGERALLVAGLIHSMRSLGPMEPA